MSFSKYVVTNAGRDLLLACMQTGDFRITKLVLGSGRYSGIMTEIQNVVTPVLAFEGDDLDIGRRESQIELRARLTNEQLENGFDWREYGVYAADGAREVLYCYDNAGEDAVPISSLSSGSKVSTTIKIILTVSDAATVNVTFTPETEIFVDDALSLESANPVQNRVVKAALDEKAASDHTHSFSDLEDKPSALDGEDGVTFTPSITDGVLSWTNDGGRENPAPVSVVGAQGEPGVTPVKGTDYFTEADKTELVTLVLAALPAAEGVSF